MSDRPVPDPAPDRPGTAPLLLDYTSTIRRRGARSVTGLWVVAAVLVVALCLVGWAYWRAPTGSTWHERLVQMVPDRAADTVPIPRPELLTTDPSVLRKVSAAEAIAINAAMPTAPGPVPAATPLMVPADDQADWARSLDCMTAAIYYEAAREPDEGQRAVAQVVLNRVRHPLYPRTVCGVVFEGHERATGCQFSFTCDGSLRHRPVPAFWDRARRVAAAALQGSVYAPVGWATNYHANYVAPYWAPTLLKTATVGAHIFYRLPGSAGRPEAFTGYYVPVEDQTLVALALGGGTADEGATTGGITTAAERPVLDNQPTAQPSPAITATSGATGVVPPPRRATMPRWVIGSDPAPATGSGTP